MPASRPAVTPDPLPRARSVAMCVPPRAEARQVPALGVVTKVTAGGLCSSSPNVDVLRWAWRAPPFTLADDPSYPARAQIEYPRGLSRGLVLVKWWLLAIPHYIIIVGVFTAGEGPGGRLAGGAGRGRRRAAQLHTVSTSTSSRRHDCCMHLDRWAAPATAQMPLDRQAGPAGQPADRRRAYGAP